MRVVRRAEVFLATIALIWGATFVVIKVALDHTEPFLYTSIRFAVGTLVAGLLWTKHLRYLNKQSIVQGLVLGVLFSVGFLLQTWGLLYTSPSRSAFITGSMVIFTPMFTWLLERKTIDRWQMIGVLLVLPGLLILTDPSFTEVNYGDLATLGCAVTWGLYITLTDVFTRNRLDIDVHSANISFLQFVVSGLMAMIAYFTWEFGTGPKSELASAMAPSVVFAILYTAVLGSVFSTFVQSKYQREASPVSAVLIFSSEPVIASALSSIFLHETYGVNAAIGGAIILVGLVVGGAGSIIFAGNRKRL